MIPKEKAVLPKSRNLKMKLPINIIAPGEQVRGTSFKHTRFLLLLVTALLTIASPVMADNRQGAFTLSPFFGGQGFPFNGESHFDADWNWGARGGYNFTKNFRLEAVFGMNNTVHDPEVENCTVYQYGADLLYAFRPDKKLVPFVSVGFGVFDARYRGTYGEGGDPTANLSDDIKPYFNYGVGVEYALTRWLALRAEFHQGVTLDSGLIEMQGSLGVTFQFGGR
jgi:OOP family OmpA-OmpF porin